jgi:hypothetical protein
MSESKQKEQQGYTFSRTTERETWERGTKERQKEGRRGRTGGGKEERKKRRKKDRRGQMRDTECMTPGRAQKDDKTKRKTGRKTDRQVERQTDRKTERQKTRTPICDIYIAIGCEGGNAREPRKKTKVDGLFGTAGGIETRIHTAWPPGTGEPVSSAVSSAWLLFVIYVAGVPGGGSVRQPRRIEGRKHVLSRGGGKGVCVRRTQPPDRASARLSSS